MTNLSEMLVDFGRELRANELVIGTGDVMAFHSAVAILDPSDLLDLYWAGRSCLVRRQEDIASYNRVFREFFLDATRSTNPASPFTPQSQAATLGALEMPETERGTESSPEPEARLGLMASSVAALKAKTFTSCTPEELQAIRRLMKQMKLVPPQRRSRRTVVAARGNQLDLRKVVRDTFRTHDEATTLPWRAQKRRQRRLILILDVSGSMADYSRNLLQFAYSASRATKQVEVFCFGTRLTRITRQLRRRRPDEALHQAAHEVFDWDGGTQIGECLHLFVKQWGRRGLARGGIVVICSDGLDRGDPQTLDRALGQLSRLCYRIIWVNPHVASSQDFQPTTLGMMVAAPHLDRILPAQNLRSLEELARVLPELR
jgi:uncharacterized protein